MKIYEFYGGEQNGRKVNDVDAVQMHYIVGNGYSPDYSKQREAGACVPREELDNELKFRGYLGPMWDGVRYFVKGEWKYGFECSEEEKMTSPECYVLRYETQDMYDRLSR